MKVGMETGSSPTVPAPTGWGWGERGRRPHLGLVCTLQRAANESSYCLSPCLHLGFATWALRRPQSWSPSQKGRAAARSVGSICDVSAGVKCLQSHNRPFLRKRFWMSSQQTLPGEGLARSLGPRPPVGHPGGHGQIWKQGPRRAGGPHWCLGWWAHRSPTRVHTGVRGHPHPTAGDPCHTGPSRS